MPPVGAESQGRRTDLQMLGKAASFRACADLAPASWSPSVPSGAHLNFCAAFSWKLRCDRVYHHPERMEITQPRVARNELPWGYRRDAPYPEKVASNHGA